MPPNKPCTKAIIPVAGFGTRRLPVTKAIEKCMIPVGNRPTIDYVVQDCIQAGITDIIFVVGEESEQLQRFYGHNLPLEEHLRQTGKTAELQAVQTLATQARFRYVVQDASQPYGTSVPVHLVRDLIADDEQFAVIFGDQFMYRPDGSSELAALLRRAAAEQIRSAMLAVEVPHEETVNYGIIATRAVGDVSLYDHIVEKPASPELAPSNLNNASFFVFDAGVLPFISANVRAEQAGEHHLIAALNDYVAAGNRIAVFAAEGEYMDCGTIQGWLKANNQLYNHKHEK